MAHVWFDTVPQRGDRLRYVGPLVRDGETVTGVVQRLQWVDGAWHAVLKVDRKPTWWRHGNMDTFVPRISELEPLLPTSPKQRRLGKIARGLPRS